MTLLFRKLNIRQISKSFKQLWKCFCLRCHQDLGCEPAFSPKKLRTYKFGYWCWLQISITKAPAFLLKLHFGQSKNVKTRLLWKLVNLFKCCWCHYNHGGKTKTKTKTQQKCYKIKYILVYVVVFCSIKKINIWSIFSYWLFYYFFYKYY